MIIYVLNVGFYYEGEETLGVYSSMEKAEEQRVKAKGWDYANITEFELDKRVENE